VKILGIVLIVLGFLGLVYQGVTVWRRTRVVDAGPLKVDASTPTTVWVPSTVAVALIVIGIVALILG
jgi:uncharacterized membrane protein YidH (DUF202 family)